MSYDLPVLSYNAELLTPFYFTIPIKVEEVYSVKPRRETMTRIETTDFPSVCGTHFEKLPTDVLSYIVELYSIPTPDELGEQLYQKTMLQRELDIKKEEFELYEDSFSYDDDEETISNTRHSFHELEQSVNDLYRCLVYTIRKHTILDSCLGDVYKLFDYYFKDTEQGLRYLKNDRYAIAGYYKEELFNEETDEADEECFKTDCVCKLLLETFHERYKCVLDVSNKVNSPDEEGRYYLYTTFKRLDDDEEPEDASQYFAELHELCK